jgi:hypothetical protein
MIPLPGETLSRRVVCTRNIGAAREIMKSRRSWVNLFHDWVDLNFLRIHFSSACNAPLAQCFAGGSESLSAQHH